tara:strand:+ start:433 stop:804 length:372 start_codon:yes stop_codon:yes gene_type:complete
MIIKLNLAFCFVFMIGGLLQFNDPDFFLWITIYFLSVLFSLLFHFKKNKWYLSGSFALGLSLFSILLILKEPLHIKWLHLFNTFQMTNQKIEVGRELGGLFIITIWMYFVTGMSVKKTKFKSN